MTNAARMRRWPAPRRTRAATRVVASAAKSRASRACTARTQRACSSTRTTFARSAGPTTSLPPHAFRYNRPQPRCAWPTAARFSLLLPATPLQMECGHVFHASCVKDLIERKWPGPAITFSFADCPCCKAELRHPSIEDAMVRAAT